MQSEDRRRLITQILRKQSETRNLLSKNSFQRNENSNLYNQMKELQTRIQELRNELSNAKNENTNIQGRQISNFLVLSKVLIDSMKNERIKFESSFTLDALLKSNEFLEIYQQMTRINVSPSFNLLDCLTGILLELSLSDEGRKKIHHYKISFYLVHLLNNPRFLKPFPAILYRIFNTMLNLIQFVPNKRVFQSNDCLMSLRKWENVISRDQKLSLKHSVLVKELRNGNNQNKSGNGFQLFGSPQVRAFQRRPPGYNARF